MTAGRRSPDEPDAYDELLRGTRGLRREQARKAVAKSVSARTLIGTRRPER
ncbi:MAG TPA: hypothetical protein VN894_20665 [Polyangiaceae bacterium]|nr:hypothetical protein [Polyangiaceae bacterium]